MIELFECGHFQKTGLHLTSKREIERGICCHYCAVYSCVLCPDSQTLEQADLVLYGHTARVWDGFLLSDCIISAGEVREVPSTTTTVMSSAVLLQDVTCRVWSYQGECVDIIEGHKVGILWACQIGGGHVR